MLIRRGALIIGGFYMCSKGAEYLDTTDPSPYHSSEVPCALKVSAGPVSLSNSSSPSSLLVDLRDPRAISSRSQTSGADLIVNDLRSGDSPQLIPSVRHLLCFTIRPTDLRDPVRIVQVPAQTRDPRDPA